MDLPEDDRHFPALCRLVTGRMRRKSDPQIRIGHEVQSRTGSRRRRVGPELLPLGKRPRTIENGIVELYLRSENSNWGDMHSSTKSSLTFYPDVCACLGAFWYAEAAGDTDLFNRQVAKAEGEAVMKGMGNYTPYRRSTPSCAARSSSTSTTGASESWSDA